MQESCYVEDSLLRLEATLPGDTVDISVIVEIGTVTHCEMRERRSAVCLWRSGGWRGCREQDTDW